MADAATILTMPPAAMQALEKPLGGIKLQKALDSVRAVLSDDKIFISAKIEKPMEDGTTQTLSFSFLAKDYTKPTQEEKEASS